MYMAIYGISLYSIALKLSSNVEMNGVLGHDSAL